MIKYFLLLIACSYVSWTYAQVEEIRLPPSLNKSGMHLIPSYSQEDSSLVIFSMNTGSVDVIKLDHNLKEIAKQSTSIPSFNSRLIGKLISENHAALIFAEKKFTDYNTLR